MGFFKKIKSSIYGPEFYQELTNKPFSFSFGYLALFSLLITLVATLYFMVMIVPKADEAVGMLETQVIEKFPSDLSLTLKGGSVSTNVPEPYFFKASEDARQAQDLPANIVTIDTQAQASAENLEKYDTMILVTKNNLIYREDSGKVTIQSLANAPDFELNRESLRGLYAKVAPFLKTGIWLILIFLMLFIYPYFISSSMIYLLFGALLIWIIAKVKGVSWGYGKSYQAGIHLITLPMLVSLLPLPSFPFSFTLLLIILAAVNIRKDEQSAAFVTSNPTAPGQSVSNSGMPLQAGVPTQTSPAPSAGGAHFCQKCGAAISPDVPFCGNCGNKLK